MRVEINCFHLTKCIALSPGNTNIPALHYNLFNVGWSAKGRIQCTRKNSASLPHSYIQNGAASQGWDQSYKMLLGRVARWYIFKPKIPIWVNFGGPYNGKCWYIVWSFWNILRLLVYVMVILVMFDIVLYIFPRFGILCQEKSVKISGFWVFFSYWDQ
jgi:hypothetical protein